MYSADVEISLHAGEVAKRYLHRPEWDELLRAVIDAVQQEQLRSGKMVTGVKVDARWEVEL